MNKAFVGFAAAPMGLAAPAGVARIRRLNQPWYSYCNALRAILLHRAA